MQVGGSVESISIAGRDYSVTADADISRKLGGSENEVQSNGNDTCRIIKTRVVGKLTGCVVGVDDANGDQEFLQSVADSNDLSAVAITFASGEVYQGNMTIEGEVSYSSQSATASFDLGGGTLTKQ